MVQNPPTQKLDSPPVAGTGGAAAPPTATGLGQHPIGFWFFFWGEFAERCSYYGMRAILLLYMIDALKFEEGKASEWMHIFMAAVYFTPLLGGWIADRFFGKYWTIVGFSLPYILGHVILGVEDVRYLAAALCLLAMGSGVIKPNISTLMGLTYDQQRPGQDRLRGDAFAMFYFAVNIGAFLSSMAMPRIRNDYGYSWAFLFPAALMVLAFALFAAGKPFYAKETIGKSTTADEDGVTKWGVLTRILGLFGVVAFFWLVFDQSVSTLTLFAKDHLDLTLRIFGTEIYTFTPDQVQSFNPLLILILLPVITYSYRLLPKIGLNPRPTDKMFVGFVLTGLTAAIMSVAGFLAGEGTVSIWWEIVAYVIVTVAEILISVTGLELAFTAAPKSMKGFVTGCWLAAVGCANIAAMFIAPLYSKPWMTPGLYFGGTALAAIPVCLAFYWVAKNFNEQSTRWAE
ncbi:MAG: MFS transporter [Planctomycetaceae bacterium]|nr:MFS transporter [Planctomycetaceae bacterium]